MATDTTALFIQCFCFSASVEAEEADYDTATNIHFDREIFLRKPVIYLSDLARKHPKVLIRKTYLYLYNVITVAVFYGLPVVQLVFIYQYVVNETGQQDLCYYNFWCAHPLGVFSDFNHIFSNVGYLVLGILFLIIVRKRETLHKDLEFDRVSLCLNLNLAGLLRKAKKLTVRLVGN